MSRQVSLTYLNDYGSKALENAVKDSVANLGVANIIKPKMKVLIKVCLPTAVSPDSAETTHPAVVRAISNWIKEMGAEAIVADCPYKKHSIDNIEKVYLNTGMLETANLTNCVLNKDLSTSVFQNPNGVMSKSLTLLNLINDVDCIINVGKVKIDEKLGYMGAVSNLFGFVPGEIKTEILGRLNYHKDLHNFLLDIYEIIKPKLVLNVLDAIVSKEAGNQPRMLNCLAISDNIFCLDAAMVDILNLGFKNTALKQAKARGFFDFEKGYRTISEKVDKFKVEDFALIDFNDLTKIHKSERKKKSYFKNHQLRAKISPKSCKGCGICTKVCPTNAITMKTDKNGELYASIDYSKCIFCNKCHTACPYKVVDIILPVGHKKIMKEIDKQNYKEGV